MKRFTETHEWVEIQDQLARVGISNLLQKEIGQIVFIDLPKVGQVLTEGQEAAILESTKAALDTYAPLSGTVVAINTRVKDNPSLINSSPENEGWLYQIALSQPEELRKLCEQEP